MFELLWKSNGLPKMVYLLKISFKDKGEIKEVLHE